MKIIPALQRCIVCILFVLSQTLDSANAQEVPPTVSISVEQQLENLTENGDDVETEDDSYLQQMAYLLKDPVNLNTATESDLKELLVLSPLQIQNLLSYRGLFGSFINIYELQAIPAWNVPMLQKIKPYVTVSQKVSALQTMGDRLHDGVRTVLVRISQTLERAKGYSHDTGTANYYAGSPQKLLIRYKYQYKNLLQYGFTAEKDAGEQFFKGSQRTGFDFYSGHFYVQHIGLIKSLALGDFTVNLGQGLTQWQGLAFKKSADVLNIKRQADVLRPYNSSGEIAFNRGAGITLQKDAVEATAFISYRKLDANFISDTVTNEDYVSSLQTSGYHRTRGEIEDKNSQGQFTAGGNLSFSKKNLHFGLSGVYYHFALPIIKGPDLYNRYALSGNRWGNYSADYSYTFKNVHFFGEAAIDKNLDKAFINGLLISTDARVDMSFLYRNISKGYQSLYSNAFTENTFPSNESGFFAGISMYPSDSWKIDAYADLFHFPWLRYRVDAPVSGHDYLVQVTFKPNKQLEIYTRFRAEEKSINMNPAAFPLNPVLKIPRQNWRTQWSYKLTASSTLRSRIELLWYDKRGNAAETGFLAYTDVIYKPQLKRYSGNMRFQYFETGGYNSRLYAFEDDLLYSYSIPVFYDKGYRYYLNLTYDPTKNFSIWLRIAQSIFPGKAKIGSGLDEISGNTKSELKMQAILTF